MAKNSNAPPEIQILKLSLMEPMPGNREFGSGKDKKSLTELANSIEQHGIKLPLLLRPHPRQKGRFEIVAGCRRHEAAALLKLADAPCIVENLSDVDARELRLIENVQRVGIHEMEEARGYQQLLDLRDDKGAPVHTIATLSQKTGKSEAYLYARIKLLRMPDVAQETFLKGKLNASVALLLCRIPDPKVAHKAALQVLDRYGSGFTADREKRALDPECEPMSFRQAKDLIQQQYMRRLKGCKFEPEDESLVPVVYEQSSTLNPPPSTAPTGKGEVEDSKARHAARNGHGDRIFGGKCSDCPFRTGNMKKLAPDVCAAVENSPDVCTNTACFAAKEKATVKADQAKFKAKGQELLTETKARRVLNYDGTALSATDEYVDLRATVPGKKVTWEEALEGHLPEGTTPIVARGKKNFLLLDVDTVAAAAKKASIKFEKPEPRSNGYDPEAQRREEEKREKRKAFARLVLVQAQKQLLVTLPKEKPDALLRFVFSMNHRSFRLPQWDGKEHPNEKQYLALVEKMTANELLVALAMNNFPESCNWQGEFQEEFVAICKDFGVDIKAIIEAEGKKQKEDADQLELKKAEPAKK